MTDAASGRVPVLRCVKAAWQFLFGNWLLLLPAALIISVVSAAAPALLAVSGSGAAVYLAIAIVAIADIFFVATVLRKAVRDEFAGPIGLGFGADELHLLGVLGSLLLVFLPPVILIAMVISIIALARAGLSESDLESMTGDPEAMNRLFVETMTSPPGIILGLVCLVVFAVVVARLSMVYAATIGERRIVIFQTWPWTRGNVLRVLAAMILTGLPVVLMDSIAQEFIGGLISTSSGVAGITIANFVLAFISALLGVPTIALGAELYKGLRPPDFVAK